MDQQNESASSSKPASGPRRRIETQIHRRKKAKPVYPLQAEWDADSTEPPPHLRMPASNLKKTP